MKKLILCLIAMLSMGVAMPTLHAQQPLLCLNDILPESACAKFNHPVQEIREVYVDVCKNPEPKFLNGFLTGFIDKRIKKSCYI